MPPKKTKSEEDQAETEVTTVPTASGETVNVDAVLDTIDEVVETVSDKVDEVVDQITETLETAADRLHNDFVTFKNHFFTSNPSKKD
jgi:GTP cyclohydrolase I